MIISAAGISGRSREQLARLTARGRQIVSVDDAVERLGLARSDAAKILGRWAEQGWLRRVRRGLYIAVPVDVERPDLWTGNPLVIATAVWSPCYFTGWTAGNHWGLTEQVFQTIVVRTSDRVRSPRQTLLDQRYLVGNVAAERMSWGIRSEWLEDTKVNFADEARVIVDVLDDPGIGGGIRHCADMLETYLVEHDRELLLEYAEELGNAAVVKRLGYLCDVLHLADERFLRACEDRLSTGIARLDPGARKGGRRNGRWRVQVNARVEGRGA
jgi:predicted transcriptional regulator of viral defense system